jgi:RNA polymerase sigma-70 factor (ECF subfamily)
MNNKSDQLLPDSGVIGSTCEDNDLVVRCLQGDNNAFALLVDRYQTPLFNTALRMTGDYEVARDVTQDALVKAYEKLATFRPEYKFFSWLYRILVNNALNVLRQRKLEQGVPVEPRVREKTPEDDYWGSRRNDAIDSAIRRLSFDQRLVIVLRHFNDMSYEQMAAILAIPEKTVKSRLYAARQNLAVILERKGLQIT